VEGQTLTPNKEREVDRPSGWGMLAVTIVLVVAGVALIIIGTEWLVLAGVVLIVASVVLMRGFFALEPNEARVIVLFGAYKGTVRKGGFHWANPFYSNGPTVKATPGGRAAQPMGPSAGGKSSGPQRAPRKFPRYKISVRARTLNGERLKVNDKRGNPVEIAAVVVWRVNDTAQAVFDVDDFEVYVETQSETALRHLASSYTYDHGEETEITLRSNVDEVSQALKNELGERLARAGVVVEEARLTHLAYAPEIAQAMLRRQQAEAIIDARTKIVHGAVSMVEMALHDLSEKGVIDFDPERKAAMISNLMVVLCGEAEVHPVVNTGTLYN